MPSYDGRVVFAIEGDDKPLKQDISSAESWLKKSVGGISDTLKTGFGFSLGTTVIDGIKSMGKAVLDFGVDSVQIASDLQEVQNVVDVTFGDDAAVIEAWAKKAGKNFGLTELQAKTFTSTLGAMMKSSGLTGDAITDMSIDMAGLAADMASFYNLDFETAFEKIRAGISGETEPLKQLGINMSVANLEAFALAEGITKSYESMSQAEQVTLRYNYLMSATADAQGDFARTSDGLANAQRTLSTEVDTLKANLGELLLPAVTSVVGAINGLWDALTPEASLTDNFTAIETSYQQTVQDINATELDATALVDGLAAIEAQTVLTDEDQRVWNATLRRLVETMPELSGMINTTTGEIEGGIPALRNYITEWGELSRQQAYMDAYNQKLAEFKDLQIEAADAQVTYNMDYSAWQAAVKRAEDYLAEIRRLEAAGQLSAEQAVDMYNYYDALKGEADTLSAVAAASGEAVAAMDEQLAYGQEQLQAYTDTMQEASAATQENLDINSGYGQSTEEMVESLGAVEEALQPLIDYQMEVRDATLEQVNGVIGGFEKMETGTATTIENMIAGLKSQTEYMNTYAANMKEAARLGVDEGLLASLSDGSVQSAAYLAAIVTGSEEEIDALNAEWLRTQEGKNTFVDVLTEQKLKADSEYQQIYDTAKETIDGLNMEGAARASLTATVQGMIDGIDQMTPELQSKVDAIREMLQSVYEINNTVDAWQGNSGRGRGPQAITIAGSHASGLDYVPYDGYIAELHRGETVLTAQDAEIWRAGEEGIDYGAMAAAIWAQAPTGELTVVLDTGELVGAISTAQAGELTALERSGWHGAV